MNEILSDFLAEQNEKNPVDFSQLDTVEFRQAFPERFAEGSYQQNVNKIDIEINLTGNKILARLYKPFDITGTLPVLVYFHGGGFVLGTPALSDSICEGLAFGAQCVVVSIDYRLAPEHQFPTGLQDAFEALNWVYHNAATLGIDPERIAVGGNSAGGNFAAVLAQASTDVVPMLCHQVLLFPVVNYGFDSTSMREYAQGFFLSRNMMQWFWETYVPGHYDKQDPLISPLQAHQLKGVCSATIITAEYDILRDDAHSYAEKLIKAGVPVTLKCWNDSIHDFILMPDKFPAADEALIFAAEKLKNAFATFSVSHGERKWN
ncbi:Lipase 2 [Serratia grimesii]|jgi:acetyl esterase|uniref:alpha/beta hydrolase n=1 Tax=Serratia grimesii TaxID=82995 RepID=UPI00217B3D4F|nr:alpha/beta hydrolase [Serratia grimesii]CAI1898528.1 Lipase 2 [Serratia grimesii]